MTWNDDADPQQGAAATGTDEGGQEEPELSPHEQKMQNLRAELLGEGEGAEEAADDEEQEELPLDEDEGEPVEAGAEGEEDPEGEAAEGEEEEDDGLVTVKLPGRKPDDEDFEFPIPVEWLEEQGIDPEEAYERLAQARNGYVRRQEVDQMRSEAKREREEFEQTVLQPLQEDPAGFLTEAIDEDVRADVARELLLSLDSEAFDSVLEKADRWARDPKTREREKSETELKRLKAEREREKSSEVEQNLKSNVEQIGSAINELIPDDMDEGKAKRFFRIAATELQRHVKAEKLDHLEPEKVPEVLGNLGVLEDYGLSANGADAGPPSSNGTSSAASKKATGKKGPKGKGGDVRERMRRRKNAAATPAGAGSSAASGFRKKEGETYKERRNRLAKTLGLPQKE